MDKKELTRFIKEQANQLGFQFCGISKSGFLEKEAIYLENWLKAGKHGEMKYLENYFDLRTNPEKLVEGAKSVISVLLNYFPSEPVIRKPNVPKISIYALGKDYHLVIREKLNKLLSAIQVKVGSINGRGFVDSAPVMDKVHAANAGLGWIGKHTNLIHKSYGSWFFIGEIIVDIELDYDQPVKDFCGTCTKCIDACPTQALSPYEIDATRCISYLTIELKNKIPDNYKANMENWVFGCDICQEVCPWNSFAVSGTEEDFKPLSFLLERNAEDWKSITKEVFKKEFEYSAISRVKLNKFIENIEFIER